MSGPLHIVASGARTAVGLKAEQSAAAVRAGVSRVALHPFMVDPAGENLRAACDSTLDSRLFGASRANELARAALEELASKVTGRADAGLACPVFLALPEPRPGFTEAEALVLARGLGQQAYGALEVGQVMLAQRGHAGALHALELAVAHVTQGKTELAIAGGVDTYLEADALDWLESHRRLAREGIRSGFPPGEGAGFVAITSDRVRRRLRLPSLARIRNAASSSEATALDSEVGTLGAGLTQAVMRAAAGMRPPSERISDLYCDINGERFRTDELGFAVLRTAELFEDASAYTSAVGEWGDVGAATGALNCILATQAWQRGYARGTRAMIWGSSWSGLRAAVMLEQGGE